MAPIVGWGIPGTLRAGDTWEWKTSHGDYPASEGWTLEYEIKGVSALTWSASWVATVGAEHTVTVPAASTAELAEGRYEYALRYVGTGAYVGKEYTVETGTLNVRADLEAAVEGDRQSVYEERLNVIRAVIDGRVTDDISSYTIGGRQVVKIPLQELLALEAALESKVARLKRGGAIETPVEVWC
jgi:hypothetical protein